MPSSGNDSVFSKKLIEILDKIIEKGYWENTLFLQAAGKKLRDFRERVKGSVESITDPPEQASGLIHRYIQGQKKISTGKELVFILIYSANGSSLKQWEGIISSLAAHSMTRPVYKNEADVQAVIRSKPNKQNDAYIAFTITSNDISPTINKKPPVDRHGNELVVLREGVIHPDKLEYFVHVSGQYVFQNGRLIRLEASV